MLGVGSCREDHLMVPLPGLGVDGLADSAQDAQGLPGVLCDKAVPEGLQRSDGCWGCVQQRHLQTARCKSALVAVVRHDMALRNPALQRQASLSPKRCWAAPGMHKCPTLACAVSSLAHTFSEAK